MKCYNCGFENKPGVSFCHQCGVNLKNDDADVLNKEFNDNRTGKLRIAKTKCATLIVFTGFFIFAFLITLLKFNIFVSIIVGLLFGFVFAFPVLIIGSVAGRVIDKIFN